MTQLNKIQGVLRLATPLHCAQPQSSAVVTDDGKVSYASGAKGKPVTVTMQMPVATKQGIQRIPYFPGNDLRGRLRRKAASRVMDVFAKNGTPIKDVTLYTGLTCGASSAIPENVTSIEENTRARSNIYMGLFGGGTRMIRSGYRMQDMVPIIDSTLEIGMVPAAFGASVDGTGFQIQGKDGQPINGWELLHLYHILRVDDVMRVARPAELKAVIENGEAAVAEFQAKVLAERPADKKDADGKSTRSRVENMAAIQTVAAGTPMFFSMDLEDYLSDEQVGLAILSLVDLIKESALGGYVRAGCGKVIPTGLSVIRDGEEFPLFSDEQTMTLSNQAKALADLAEAAIANLTINDMAPFFESAGN